MLKMTAASATGAGEPKAPPKSAAGRGQAGGVDGRAKASTATTTVRTRRTQGADSGHPARGEQVEGAEGEIDHAELAAQEVEEPEEEDVILESLRLPQGLGRRRSGEDEQAEGPESELGAAAPQPPSGHHKGKREAQEAARPARLSTGRVDSTLGAAIALPRRDEARRGPWGLARNVSNPGSCGIMIGVFDGLRGVSGADA